jgi:hypothetical protein
MIGPDDVEDHMIRASGLCSGVPVAEGSDEIHGHILMLDYDGEGSVLDVVADLDGMPGVSVILESSEGSYHAYNTTVRSFDRAIVSGTRSSSDLEHVRQSARRGYYVLRWTRKLFDADPSEVYKERPEVVYCNVVDTDREQSGPHLDALAGAARETDATDGAGEPIAETIDAARERLPTVGESTLIDHYRTATDALKRAMRGD